MRHQSPYLPPPRAPHTFGGDTRKYTGCAYRREERGETERRGEERPCAPNVADPVPEFWWGFVVAGTQPVAREKGPVFMGAVDLVHNLGLAGP